MTNVLLIKKMGKWRCQGLSQWGRRENVADVREVSAIGS